MLARVLTAIRYPGTPLISEDLDDSHSSRSEMKFFKIGFPLASMWNRTGNFALCDTTSQSPVVAVVSTTERDEIEAFLSLIRDGKLSEVEKRVNSGFNLRSRDDESWNCLHWATEMGHQKLVVFLLDKDPLLLNMKTQEGLSAINIAAWRGDKRMVELLLAQGAEIDDRTKWGEVPLHHAVTFGHAEVCEVLLKAGADPFSEDKLQRTPYSVAMQKGTSKVKKIFAKFAPQE